MSTYACQSCGRIFAVPQKTLDKYPSWQPKNCLRCHSATKPAATRPANRSRPPRQDPSAAPAFAARSSAGPERILTLSEVLQAYSDGPATGVFTDGAAHPNPGPGGWGAVFVVDNAIIAQARGAEPQTTNNRMELTALLAGYGMVPPGTAAVVLTDSQLRGHHQLVGRRLGAQRVEAAARGDQEPRSGAGAVSRGEGAAGDRAALDQVAQRLSLERVCRRAGERVSSPDPLRLHAGETPDAQTLR